MLETQELDKEYLLNGKIVSALTEINIHVAQGEFLAIMGQSGSGKSTLLQILGGLDRPSRGRVLFRGRALNDFSDRELSLYRNREVGFVFQQFHLQAHLNLRENVALPLHFAPEKNDHDLKARTALAAVDLLDRQNHLPSEVSGGQAQRAGIARAIVNNPSLLLADEPTGELDGKTGRAILSLLKKLRETQNLTLIVVTHDPVIARAADRILELKNGRSNRTNHA